MTSKQNELKRRVDVNDVEYFPALRSAVRLNLIRKEISPNVSPSLGISFLIWQEEMISQNAVIGMCVSQEIPVGPPVMLTLSNEEMVWDSYISKYCDKFLIFTHQALTPAELLVN